MSRLIRRLSCLVILAAFACSACGRQVASTSSTSSSATSSEPYTPGLGEIMSLQQMRHAKLWFAGQAENWELADYEIDELGEGFDVS
jgi:hypothetical protein